MKKRKRVSASHPEVKEKINATLKSSKKEGVYASISTNVGATYISPFAIFMNATSSQVGILTAIINLIPSVIQLWAARLNEKISRKKLVMRGVLYQTLTWIPIILVGILFYYNFSHVIPLLILFVGIFYAFGGIVYPAWFSWMGSLVPEKTRGKYFSRRNILVGIFGIFALVMGAVILESSKKIGENYGDIILWTLFGFITIFLLAFITRIYTIKLFSEHYEPKIKIKKEDYFSFIQFLKRAPETPFGRFTIFRGFLSIAIGIAAPFWTVYMLRNLNFSYIWFMAVIVLTAVFQILFLPVLGKASDKFGNMGIVKLSSNLMFLIPLLWFFSIYIPNDLFVKLYIVLVPSVISGFAWAGYNLSTNNYIYDTVNQEKRTYGVSYMNLIVGIGLFIGSLIGSLITFVGVSFMAPILFVFLLSSLIRFFVAKIGLKYLREVKHVKKFSSYYLIREFKPAQGIVREVHNFEKLVKNVEHYI